jgi:NAD(P)-dependent dehydrogenase (short-subunit alcohol dehydrogenase family)
MDTPLSGKTFVVTGSTSGIGLAVAEALVSQGANLLGVGRSRERCRAAEARLQRLNPQAKIVYFEADLSLQSQVRALAAAIRAWLAGNQTACLDGLVNNAGTFTYWMALTAEGFETQWAVNHLAPFLLTRELLPLLQAAPTGRVVTVSSDSHHGAALNWADIQLRRSYNGLRAYGQSKLANVLFTLELNRRLAEYPGLRAFAADPGLVRTEIGFKGTPPIVRWVWNLRRAAAVPPEHAARGIAYLVSAPEIQDAPQLYWKDGHPARSSRQSQDAASAARLWALSERMCAAAAAGGVQ